MRFGDIRKLLDVTYTARTEEGLVGELARAGRAEMGYGVQIASYDEPCGRQDWRARRRDLGDRKSRRAPLRRHVRGAAGRLREAEPRDPRHDELGQRGPVAARDLRLHEA